jgi:hypothetical protein
MGEPEIRAGTKPTVAQIDPGCEQKTPNSIIIISYSSRVVEIPRRNWAP